MYGLGPSISGEPTYIKVSINMYGLGPSNINNDFSLEFSYLIDSLTSIMLILITTVGMHKNSL